MFEQKRIAAWLKTQWQRTSHVHAWRLRVAVVVMMIASVALASYGISAVRAQGDQSEVTVCVNKWNGAMRVLLRGDCDRSEYPMTVNPEGIPGPPGPPGSPGPSGADGLTGYTVILGSHDTANGDSWSLDCPTGMVAIDGGAKYRDDFDYSYVFATLGAYPKFDSSVGFPAPSDDPLTTSALPIGWSFEYEFTYTYDDYIYTLALAIGPPFNDAPEPERNPIIDSWVSCMNAPASQP